MAGDGIVDMTDIEIQSSIARDRATVARGMSPGPVPECSCAARVTAAEDVVIQELRWTRCKDLDDVVNLLTVSGGILDWDYLRRWTGAHGTTGLLEQLRQEVDG